MALKKNDLRVICIYPGVKVRVHNTMSSANKRIDTIVEFTETFKKLICSVKEPAWLLIDYGFRMGSLLLDARLASDDIGRPIAQTEGIHYLQYSQKLELGLFKPHPGFLRRGILVYADEVVITVDGKEEIWVLDRDVYHRLLQISLNAIKKTK